MSIVQEIYMGPKCPKEEPAGVHCVLIVGYGTQMVKKRNKKGKVKKKEKPVRYWLVKNGWGLDWGSGGYGKICMKTSLPPGSESFFYRASIPII